MFVPPPDRAAREAILKALLAQRPVAADVDAAAIAAATSGHSGADLSHLVETASDEAIQETIASGREVPISASHVRRALGDAKATTVEWLTTARNYARYANEGGQYDDVLAFLKAHGRE
jgi:SpoVK/Ycf46/Vps4 family AAA+-type ATPase